jgi:light-regulated signal transduction histidine kinase (bacteriophytochrome)
MKEPLRKIAMFSDLIITTDWDELSEKTKTNLQKITDASKRMQQLIEGILSYSSLNISAVKENYSLEEALKEAINNLEFKIKETSAVIESDSLPTANVVPFQMQQLFQNLLANALKFAKKNVQPKIAVTHTIVPKSNIASKNLQPADHYLEIKISDNGIGFSNDVAERIFGLFQRLHSKSAYEGSGLGLAICKRIAEYHGGTITASSKENTGSTFIVLLPID